jgi:hypothetical protein
MFQFDVLTSVFITTDVVAIEGTILQHEIMFVLFLMS